MKLLAVMHRFPWPPRTGSALVAYNSIKELAKRHSVSMICQEEPESTGDLADVLESVRYPGNGAASRQKMLMNLMLVGRGIPPLISATASLPMELLVNECARQFDALVLFELHAIQYCPAYSHEKIVVNIEDPLSIKYRFYSQLSVYSFLQRLRFLVDARLLARYERRVLPRLARVLLLSQADVNSMREKGGHTNLGQVAYGTSSRNAGDIVDWNQRTPGAIVFSGNMWHGPNVDAALFFLRDVFPIVVLRAPSAVLWIVGSNPDKRIVQAARRYSDRVKVTGQVPDIAEYVSKACVSICPVRVRVGVQTKVLEALSVGTPVVSTSAGNAGIGGVSGKHLWVADEPEEFAARVVGLINGNGWKQMSEDGRKLVLAEFNWQRSAAALEGYLAEVTTHPAVPRRA